MHLTHEFSWKQILSTDDLVPLSNIIKPNYIAVTHVQGYWLNLIEVRRDDDHLLQSFFALPHYSLNLLIYLLACVFFDILVRSIAVLIDFLFLILQYIKHIY